MLSFLPRDPLGLLIVLLAIVAVVVMVPRMFEMMLEALF